MNKLIASLLNTTIENVNPEFISFAETKASFCPVVPDETMIAMWIADWRSHNPEHPITDWVKFEEELREKNRAYQRGQRAEARAARLENREVQRAAISEHKDALDKELEQVTAKHQELQAGLNKALTDLEEEAARDAAEEAEDSKG